MRHPNECCSGSPYAALFLGALVLGMPTPGSAQADPSTLTLSEAVAATLVYHPAAARGREAVLSAQASLGEVRGTRWPSLYGSGGIVGFQEPMLVAPLHTFEIEELQADPPRFEDVLISSQLNLEYLLWDGGSRGSRVAGAEAGAVAADLSREALDASLMEAVTGQFLQLRVAREVEVAHDQRILALEAELDRVTQLIQQGVAAPVEDLRARAALAEAQADLESARAETTRATRNLARFMGVSEDEIVTRPLLQIPVPTDLVAPGISARNPMILAAERQVDVARLAAEASAGTWWPELFASAQLNQYGSTQGYFSTEWNIGMGLRYPIFTGGSRGNAIDRAQADLRQTEEALRETRLETETQVDRAETGWAEARVRADALREAVQLMEEVARVERLALDEGVGIQRDLLDAEASLLRSRAALIEAEGSAVLARTSLARANGTLTPEWIATYLENTP